MRRNAHDNVREAAVFVIERTLDSKAPTSTFMEGALRRTDPRDHALLRELVQGTLRWLKRIDHVLGNASSRGFGKIEPKLRAPLRVAAYQLLFLDRIPPHAAVNEAVEQALSRTHRGGASFVNGVLRRLARARELSEWRIDEEDPWKRLSIEGSHPEFLVRRWGKRFGEEATRRLLDANNRAKPMHLLAFVDRGGREILAEQLIEEDIELAPSCLAPVGLKVLGGNPLGTEAFARGEFYIQDEASQLAALLPPPREGERVLDLACAPGGKTFSLLSFEPSVRCVAADVSISRLHRMRQNMKRLGRAVPLVACDAASPPLRGEFDRVVVDLPCTGTGTLRKNPELKWRLEPQEIERLAESALHLLEGAAQQVAVGGLLVAITCSIEPEENEDLAARFYERCPDFGPEPLESCLDRPASDHIYGPGAWRLLPGADHDGFSVQVSRRVSR